jgi:apolipoprotein N-acyltransferase
VLDPSGQLILQYDKIHLVPFGEYVPSWLSGTLGKITSQVGDYVSGTRYQWAASPEGAIGIFICYESIFPQLVRRLTPAGPSVLVTISDDAWYGDSSAAYQHLEMARLRAIENHRFLLRSTNDGVTAIIDPYGRILATIPRHRALVLTSSFSFLAGETFYRAHGDVFAWLCVAVVGVILGLAVLGRKVRSRQ